MTDVLVVIPTRARPELLEAAVESVLGQTRPPERIVIVDDASPESLRPDPAGWSGRGVRVDVVQLEANVGGAVARNIGWRSGTESLVAFLDDDDVFVPAKLERQLTVFENSAVEFSWTAYRNIHRASGEDRGTVRPETSGVADLLRASNLSNCTLMARRSLLDRVGGYDESLPRNQDWDLFLRLFAEGEGRYLDEVLTEARFSTPSPEACIEGMELLDRKWHEAIEALDPALRRRVHAEHAWIRWSNYARIPDRRREWAAILRALRLLPTEARYWRSLLITLLHQFGWTGRHAGEEVG